MGIYVIKGFKYKHRFRNHANVKSNWYVGKDS